MTLRPSFQIAPIFCRPWALNGMPARLIVPAVQPRLALLSSGPKQYSGTTLPDPEVLAALAAAGAAVLRTDERDGTCPVTGRIGGDRGPGGCDSWVISIDHRPADVLDPRSP